MSAIGKEELITPKLIVQLLFQLDTSYHQLERIVFLLWQSHRYRRRLNIDEIILSSLPLQQLTPQRHGLIRHAQRDIAVFVVEPRHEALRHERTNLFLGEVHHCNH